MYLQIRRPDLFLYGCRHSLVNVRDRIISLIKKNTMLGWKMQVSSLLSHWCPVHKKINCRWFARLGPWRKVSCVSVAGSASACNAYCLYTAACTSRCDDADFSDVGSKIFRHRRQRWGSRACWRLNLGHKFQPKEKKWALLPMRFCHETIRSRTRYLQQRP